jgi:hypothetical protein
MHKAILGWPILLMAASCVPAAVGKQLAMNMSPVSAGTVKGGAAPGFQALSLPVATEAPPPLEKLAEEIAVGAPAQPFNLGSASGGDVQSAVNCLTAAIYYEARSESESGQRAVAQVVLNRVRHPAFPNTVCGVVYQGSNRSTGCQFSFTCDGSLGHARDRFAWERARKIAEEALAGEVYAPVGVATHYHTTAIRPWWAASLTRAVTIGSHIFYRWRGEWGDPRSFRRPYVGAEAMARAASREGQGEAAVPAKVEVAAGVTVHRGAPSLMLTSPENGSGVRVHRSAGSTAAFAGVRVHRGVEASEGSAEPEPVGQEGAGAVVAVR